MKTPSNCHQGPTREVAEEFTPKPFAAGSVVEVDGLRYEVLSDAPGGVWALPASAAEFDFSDVVLIGRPAKSFPAGRVKGRPFHSSATWVVPGVSPGARVFVAEAIRWGRAVARGAWRTVSGGRVEEEVT